MNTAKILVVDDERQIRRLLRAGLSSYGYAVTLVSGGDEAFASVVSQTPDIILLDTHLGSSPDGLEVCRVLRQQNTSPIIMLTIDGNKKATLAALNAGADDCLTKPFDVEELEARIRAVLRRHAVVASHTVNGEIRVHDLVIDLVKRRALLKGDDIHLTPVEYKLLYALAAHPGEVLNYDTLIQEIKVDSENPKLEHHLRVYINTIRKKLREDRSNRTQSRYIYNEYGVGYRFADVQPNT